MKLRRRELLLAGIFAVTLVGIFAMLFFLKTGYPRYALLATHIRGVEESLRQAETILAGKERVEKEFAAFEKNFSLRVPGKFMGATDILQEIKRKAGDAGLNVINIKPLVQKEEALSDVFDVKLETEGSILNFGKFLYDLDNSPYLFTLKYTQLNAQAQEEVLKIQLLVSASLAKGY
jgi:Tfp pilus assembly protein PilO